MYIPETDLQFRQHIPSLPPVVWGCLTLPRLIQRWAVQAPWTAEGVQVDLSPGGEIRIETLGPTGARGEARYCVLVAQPRQRLIVTDFLRGGFRPANTPRKTAIFDLQAQGSGTDLTLTVMHATPAARAAQSRLDDTVWSETVLHRIALVAQAPLGR